MKRKMIHTLHLLVLAIIATTFGGCNNEDDVIEIFTGKTWKMTFIAAPPLPSILQKFAAKVNRFAA